MKLTSERTEMLGKYLQENVERAKTLVELEPAEALKKINADGYDFSIEEIIEFGENLRNASASDELTEENLSKVAGGVIGAAAAAVYLTCVSIGVTLGLAAGDHKRW